jgi:hypothetical protein
MTLYVREYSWMWNDLHLSLAECRVYAYIHGLTHGAKGGYDGSKRHLAELLGLSTSATKNILDALTEKHLIVCTDSSWKSVRSENADSVHSENENVRSENENVLSENSPHTPLYNNIKNKNKASMQTDFEKFWNYFKPSAEYQNRRAATQMIFEARSEVAQKAIIEAAQEGGGYHPDDQQNPYFFVQDFPEPQPDWKTGGEINEDLVQVLYNGHFKICTRATMELFGLEWVRDW